jgi:hypothetical protein
MLRIAPDLNDQRLDLVICHFFSLDCRPPRRSAARTTSSPSSAAMTLPTLRTPNALTSPYMMYVFQHTPRQEAAKPDKVAAKIV